MSNVKPQTLLSRPQAHSLDVPAAGVRENSEPWLHASILRGILACGDAITVTTLHLRVVDRGFRDDAPVGGG